MKKLFPLLLLLLCLNTAQADPADVWRIQTADGTVLTEICETPSVGDEYISADDLSYRITRVAEGYAVAELQGKVTLPSLDWMDADSALPVATRIKRIALYCTHSDESYTPSDGYYSSSDRGSIYQIANALASALASKGIDAEVAGTLHHPHDAGAYRRSRQTAVALLKSSAADCLIDIHRDGIPDPDSYAVTIGGQEASKIRLLVGRGNQNAAINKEFALTIKAIADRIYPGLIKDIYMGKGTYNQDLLPHSILLECGTYTLEKERVLVSMPFMADVLQRALYGGVVGSAGRITSDAGGTSDQRGSIVEGVADAIPQEDHGIGAGIIFLAALLIVGVAGFAVLSSGTLAGGVRKAGRSLSEMTGGLIGKKPDDHEDPQHSC